jgi:hypothetical protein
LGKIATVMQEPFTVLTGLSISSDSEDETLPILPSTILGGSAPGLRRFELFGIPFPALPTLLLSASGLVELKLRKIPPTGYISPETMVAHLAALPSLKILDIGFQLMTSGPDIMVPPETRTVLPALCDLFFSGVCGYLEDFVARIDAPQLGSIVIFYSDQVANFEVPQLSEFINRSENLKDTLSNHCQIMIDDYDDAVDFCVGGVTSDEAERWDPETGISVWIMCEGIDRQILHLAHILSWISPILSDTVHFTINHSWLFISENLSELEDLDDIEWLQLLRPFSSVQTLFVSGKIAGDISRALEEIDGDDGVTVTEVLPALELLCLEDQPMSSVDNFVAARQDSGHPVTIVNTKKEFEQRLKSYL